MVVSWIWYSIWKFWVIYVLVFLVFQVFSTAELISLAKTVNLAVWAFSLIFLHDFTLFGIDMHNIYHISSISTTFGPLWNMGFPGPDPNLHLALCHNRDVHIEDDIPCSLTKHSERKSILLIKSSTNAQKRNLCSLTLYLNDPECSYHTTSVSNLNAQKKRVDEKTVNAIQQLVTFIWLLSAVCSHFHFLMCRAS